MVGYMGARTRAFSIIGDVDVLVLVFWLRVLITYDRLLTISTITINLCFRTSDEHYINII